ncbi:MAG: phospholipase D-like domain-containing protein, partial [Planctomycetota bacterium]
MSTHLRLLAAALLLPLALHAETDILFTSANEGEDESALADRIIKEMKKAKKEIVIAVTHFNSKSIADALIALHKDRSSLRIRVLLDMGEYKVDISQSARLEKAGIETRYKTYSLMFHHPLSRLMHLKSMLVDGQTLLTGSYNWSDTAEFNNFENLLVLTGEENKKVISEYAGKIEELWEENRDLYPEFMKRLTAKKGSADYRRYIPIHFPIAMALTLEEVSAIRSVGWKAGFRPTLLEHWWLDRERKVASDEPPKQTFLDLASVVISEVLFRPKVEAEGEFVELYNGTTKAVDLAGWRLADGDEEEELVPWDEEVSTILEPGEYALILDPDFDVKA